jgi:hypothetical protein
MLTLSLLQARPTPTHVLCLGAHSDDIEIGCGGTMLSLLQASPALTVNEALCRRKIDTLMTNFASQRDKRWFSEDLFRSLLRLRGMECNSPSTYAEAFYGRKLVVG